MNTWKVMLPHGDRTVLSLESAFLFLFFGQWMRNLCKLFRENLSSKFYHSEDGSSMFL